MWWLPEVTTWLENLTTCTFRFLSLSSWPHLLSWPSPCLLLLLSKLSNSLKIACSIRSQNGSLEAAPSLTITLPSASMTGGQFRMWQLQEYAQFSVSAQKASTSSSGSEWGTPSFSWRTVQTYINTTWWWMVLSQGTLNSGLGCPSSLRTPSRHPWITVLRVTQKHATRLEQSVVLPSIFRLPTPSQRRRMMDGWWSTHPLRWLSTQRPVVVSCLTLCQLTALLSMAIRSRSDTMKRSAIPLSPTSSESSWKEWRIHSLLNNQTPLRSLATSSPMK